jgi:long-chain acyl-CoA synthetase
LVLIAGGAVTVTSVAALRSAAWPSVVRVAFSSASKGVSKRHSGHLTGRKDHCVNIAASTSGHPADSVALISRGDPTTYGQLDEQASRLRGGLAGLGLEPGDRVAIVCGNNWYFVVSYLAVVGAGFVAVPLNPTSPAPELTAQIAAVTARVAIVGPAARSSFSKVDRAAVPHLEYVVTTDASDSDRVLDDLLAAEPAPVIDVAFDSLAALLFTSGTAGAPRAAMLTHGNLLSNVEQLQAHPGRSQDGNDVSLGVLPMFHIFGLNVVLGLSLYAGSRVVLIERFDPSSALEALRRHGVTILPGAPGMWTAWASLPDASAEDFATVRIAASGAAKLPVEVITQCRERFGIDVTEGYGLTEASPVVTSATGTATKPGSIGIPLPGLRVRLVDEDGDDVLVGDAGEVWVKGPNVFAGYLNDPEATASVLTPDGWLRTGDIAIVDDDGALFLVDRVKDLIIVSGFNVFPAEVEEIVLEHPSVAACAVIGIAHPYTGEAVKAFVVPEAGRAIEEDDLIAFCAERLARYKCPDKIMFVSELPVAPSGKLLRRELRPA